MSLVEEKTKLGLGLVADLRQLLEELGEQPEQKGGVEARIAHQFIRGQYVDVSAPLSVGPDEVLKHESGLAEELVATLIFQHQQLALDGPDRGLGHVAVMGGELGGMIRDVAEHGSEILEIEHQESLLVGDPKTNIQHAFLNFIQI